MKRTLLTSLTLVFAVVQALYAQNKLESIGNVGIGTLSPATLLHLQAGVSPTITVESNTNSNAYLVLKGGGTNSIPFSLISSGSGSEIGGGKFAITDETGYVFTITSGKVGIGTTTPREKLSVNGTIRSQEVKVETSNWPDYVFEPEYKLLPLSETEKFIRENKHLPGIPAAEETSRNGISLGDMNARLLKKIEELTLHLIEKDKEISDLKRSQEKVDELSRKVEFLMLTHK